LEPKGHFTFDNLLEDKYQFWLYQDKDNNKRFSPGELEPYTAAEPFTISPDTVRVRSRWETEGIILHWDVKP
jgi:hypothetical protein